MSNLSIRAEIKSLNLRFNSQPWNYVDFDGTAQPIPMTKQDEGDLERLELLNELSRLKAGSIWTDCLIFGCEDRERLGLLERLDDDPMGDYHRKNI